ncbi:hypothetical protein D3C87_1065180 [compost metagenome]
MKIFICLLLVLETICLSTPQTVAATEGAEVFDIRKGEVVQLIPNSNLLQNQAKHWLSSIIGVAGSFKIEPIEGIAIKIPLTPPFSITNNWINGTVTEVIMFVGKSKNYYPILLVITKNNRFVAVHIRNHNLESFLKENKLYSSELNLAAAPLS